VKVWSTPVNSPSAAWIQNQRDQTAGGTTLALVVGDDGSIRLVEQNVKEKVETLVWVSASSCAGAKARGKPSLPSLGLNEATGVPEVHCPEGALVLLQ